MYLFMTIFLAGIGFYFISMTLIGYLASRKVSTLEDYLIAGRRLPFYLAVPTLVATFFGAGSCMGVSGAVYTQGFYGVIADPFGCTLALTIAGLFFVAPLRRLKLLTISDLLRKAYGPLFERVATLMMIPFYIGTLAAQMLAMGYIFQIVSGFTAEAGIIFGSAIMVFYTISGGMWAVTLTDFVQLGLLMIGLIVLVPVTLEQLSQPAVVFDTFVHEFTTLVPLHNTETDWLAYTGRILMTGLGAIMGQDLLQRTMSSKSESIAKWSTLTGAVFYILLGLIPLFIGIAGREIFPDLERPEQLIPLLAQEYLSPITFTIFACGLLAAIMSTADSYLLAGTTLLTHNVLLKIWPVVDERNKIKMLRYFNLIIAMMAFALASSGPTIFDMMVHSGATLFVAIFVPVSGALFLKNATPFRGWSALVGGTAVWLGYLFYRLSFEDLNEDLLFSASALGGAFSFVSFIAAALLEYLMALSIKKPLALESR